MSEKLLVIPLGDFNLNGNEKLELEGAVIDRRERFSELDGVEIDLDGDWAVAIDPVWAEVPRRTLDRVITAMKLFKDEVALANEVFKGDKKVDELRHYNHWPFGRRRYNLSTVEMNDFVQFWKSAVHIDPTLFPVHRFHLSDYDPYFINKVVSLISCLEYLLVPDSAGGEISFKFRSRGAQILKEGTSPVSRRKLYLELKKAYELRSKITHGDPKVLEGMSREQMRKILKPLRSWARELILLFHHNNCLDNAKKRKIFVEDRTIFRDYS